MQRRLKKHAQTQKSVRYILGKRRKQNNSVYYGYTINQEIMDIFKFTCQKNLWTLHGNGDQRATLKMHFY